MALAVIGCGWWGPKLVRVFDQLPGVSVKAVADLAHERLALIQQHYPHIKTVSDYRQILADPQIQAVCVATPMETHYAIARDVLDAGKHLLLEKPMTTDAHQAEELVRVATDKGLTLLVDHIFLYNPAVSYLRSMVESGQMGQLYYLESTRINLAPPTATHNVVWDLAPHDLSTCFSLFQEIPDKIVCLAKRFRHPSLEDAASLHLSFPSGKRACIHVSWLSSCKTRVTRLFGSEKSAFYDDTATDDKVRIFGKGMDTRLAQGTAAPLDHSYGPDTLQTPVLDRVEPLYQEAMDFVRSMATGDEPVGSARLGSAVVAILAAAQRSIKEEGAAIGIAGLDAL